MTLKFQDIACYGKISPTALLPDEVHVWGVCLDAEESQIRILAPYLSADERQRANRLVSAQHRRQFIVAHAAVRMVLGQYSGQSPDSLRFRTSSSGKPFLDSSGDDRISLRFNLTHSQGRALIAIARGREVGVDLEPIRPNLDVMKLAKRFLSQSDVACIEAAEPSNRQERFLQLWVAREAVCKAEGTGITFPLHRDHVELSLAASEARLIGEGRTREFPVRFLPIEPGWIGAVAAEGPRWRVVLCL